MKITKRKSLLVFLALLSSVGVMVVATQTAYLAPLFVQGETEAYRYTAQVEGANNLLITIGVDLDNPELLERYRQVNQRRAKQLVKQKGKNVPVSITLTRPLPQPEAHQLAEQAGLEVKQFIMVGHSNASGERGIYGTLGALDQGITHEREITKGEKERLILEGVMVMEGKLRDAQALTELLRDKRIYLVDTSEVEVRELLAQRHAAVIEGKTIVVGVPSPFWNLDW